MRSKAWTLRSSSMPIHWKRESKQQWTSRNCKPPTHPHHGPHTHPLPFNRPRHCQDRVRDIRHELNLLVGSPVTVAYGLLETASESSRRQTETVRPVRGVWGGDGNGR